ncbi:hypothetical protein AgCh_001953 [Apium graveolens]
MAILTKLNVVVLVFILLSFCGARTTSASSLHYDEKHNSRWFMDCRGGHRKLGIMDCESGPVGSANMNRAFWSQSLKSALSPPPAPVKKVARRSGKIASPPSE